MKYNRIVYSLDQVCKRIYSGGTPSTACPEYWGGDINWLSSGETGQKYIKDTIKKITLLGVEKSATKLAKKGCTVVASAGQGFTRGQASFLLIDTYVNQSVIVFEPNEKIILPRYLFYNLDNRYEEFRLLSDGTSTRGGLSGWIVKRMEISLPPLKEQQQVVSLLQRIDEKIDLNNAINNNLQQQAIALFQNTFPYGVEDDLPDGWRIASVGEIIELHDSRRIPLSGGERDKMENKIYPYYGATSLMDYVDNYIFDGIYLLLGEDGTVIDTKGYPVLQYVWGKFWVNNHAHILTGKLGFTVESLWVLFHLTSVRSIVTGAVQPKISQANLRSIRVVLPPQELLKSYNECIQPMFSTIRNNSSENERLSTLRDSLLPKLLNGEINVSEVEI